eukprot:g2664.t1
MGGSSHHGGRGGPASGGSYFASTLSYYTGDVRILKALFQGEGELHHLKTAAIVMFLWVVFLFPISDTSPNFTQPYYRVQCLVPFASQLYDDSSRKLPLLEAFKRFVPIVIERPFAAPRDMDEARSWVDLFKVMALDNWLHKQMSFYGKDTESISYADRLAVAYINGELIDCCEKRRPRTIPQQSGFNMFGLSPFQSCEAHVCPVRYWWKSCKNDPNATIAGWSGSEDAAEDDAEGDAAEDDCEEVADEDAEDDGSGAPGTSGKQNHSTSSLPPTWTPVRKKKLKYVRSRRPELAFESPVLEEMPDEPGFVKPYCIPNTIRMLDEYPPSVKEGRRVTEEEDGGEGGSSSRQRREQNVAGTTTATYTTTASWNSPNGAKVERWTRKLEDKLYTKEPAGTALEEEVEADMVSMLEELV